MITTGSPQMIEICFRYLNALIPKFVVLVAFPMVIPLAGALAQGQQTSTSQIAIQDVLNKRCVVCHGCYDAPCQLKLSSPDGWVRGASKTKVYDSTRLDDAPMTRLGVDARAVPEWRQKDFFAVADSNKGPSVLEQLLRAGRNNDFTLGAALPDRLNISPLRKNSCPMPSEIGDYLDDHPLGGMPFATAPLPEADYQRLLSWAMDGAPSDETATVLPKTTLDHIETIESFLNNGQLKSKLSARYIYEHLFLAHLHLEGDTSRTFFRLIRSRTPAGEPPDEIASRRPFDDPGGDFSYRLVPLNDTILHKEHIVYEIGPKRLERYRDLFLESDWEIDALPPYSIDAGGNPLSTFRAIPARSRYQFLLDDALYFVRSFIRGPVCYGQVAVNVIEDRFWVAFLAPDADLSVTDPAYLDEAIPILELPLAKVEGKISDRLKSFLTLGPIKYQELRQAHYAAKAAQNGGPTYQDIWDGDGNNIDARLTVFRNFSSASVVPGFSGAVPETAWVIDFPLFERIYYNLVAGFDVFGNVEHQLTTRIYMDGLRREGERNFLAFLPRDLRDPLHESWYQGPLVSLVDRWKERKLDTTSPTGIGFQTGQPKSEFLTELLKIEPRLWPVTDPINRCSADQCATNETIEGRLRPLAATPAPFAKFLPDIALLLVETDAATKVFTLVHDKAHSNVAFIFNEDLRRDPENDSLTVLPGQFSSYPNFIFKVPDTKVSAFVDAVKGIRTQREYLSVVERFGIRRTDPDFWSMLDLAQASLNAQDTLQAGLLDINRYRDPKPLDPIERLFEYTFSVD